jgi:polar amino acid transport system substrate-binding protein
MSVAAAVSREQQEGQMTEFFRFAVVSTVAILLGVGNACAELKFGIAAEPYPPFESKAASGEWVGWEIDLMNAVCKQLKEKCEIVEVAWDGIIPALTSKQIDVIWSSMSITSRAPELYREVLSNADGDRRC